MTPEELKAHRRKICEALIEGKRVEYRRAGVDHWSPLSIDAAEKFFNWIEGSELYSLRIKPQPRQCWVGWLKNGEVISRDENKDTLEKYHGPVKWQLVVENTGE
jgi:hypothetical protein